MSVYTMLSVPAPPRSFSLICVAVVWCSWIDMAVMSEQHGVQLMMEKRPPSQSSSFAGPLCFFKPSLAPDECAGEFPWAGRATSSDVG
jgi:hypothetical protein